MADSDFVLHKGGVTNKAEACVYSSMMSISTIKRHWVNPEFIRSCNYVSMTFTTESPPALGQSVIKSSARLHPKASDRFSEEQTNLPPSGGNTDEARIVERLEAGFVEPLQAAKEKEALSVFGFLKVITALSAVYVSVSTWGFFYDSDKKEICPYRVICATSWIEMALLTLSRLSAGALFASLTISVLSKCNATKAFLNHSWIGSVVDFEPAHDLHTYFGYLTLAAGWEHGILHIARFSVAGEAFLLYDTDVGRSGVIAMLMLLPIVLPMKYNFFRGKMSFETRKGMHMLFLLLLVCLCFHSGTFRYVGGILIVWYILDKLYFITKQTYLVPHPTFEAIGRGTMVGIDLPEGYHYKAGSYIYVNCPAIDRGEWHPFSLIPVPGINSRAAFYAEAVGDWTTELFRLGLRNPSHPLWITAAQPSPVETTLYYDNVLLICTGAGVTPALAVAERFSKKKNIHLMWIARDHGMMALFEKQLRLVNSTVHLTGKPTEEVKRAMSRLFSKSKYTPAPMNTHFESALADGVFGSNHSGGLRSILKSPRESTAIFESGNHSAAFEGVDPPGCHAVDLHFGKPDIPKFIAETLRDMAAMGHAGLACPTEVSNTRKFKRGRSREVSGRLDASQAEIKKALTTADLSAIKNADKANAMHGEGNAPWGVIYCGANVHVEKAIATSCTELNIPWRKEYFGAW